jgi:hypothetical protein
MGKITIQSQPPFVAKEFNKLMPNSELYFIDKSGTCPDDGSSG